jgi:hypothetical protein
MLQQVVEGVWVRSSEFLDSKTVVQENRSLERDKHCTVAY